MACMMLALFRFAPPLLSRELTGLVGLKEAAPPATAMEEPSMRRLQSGRFMRFGDREAVRPPCVEATDKAARNWAERGSIEATAQ